MGHFMLKFLNFSATWIEAKNNFKFTIDTILTNLLNTSEHYIINNHLYQTKGVMNIN
mgnify:CR=1 FL=1